MTPPLPNTDAHVRLSLLDGGSMTGLMSMLHAGSPPEPFRLYNWAFYIHHEKTDRHVVWDLGMAADRDEYPPFIANRLWDAVQVTAPRETIPQQIERRHGITAGKIDTVIFSHAHFDHCHPIRNIFPNAKGYFGPGTSDFCSPGHFKNPDTQWDGRFFDPERATERWEILRGPWVSFGPFERAMDFFGDGSFWIIDAPGHMPGNLGACVRIEDGNWVLLGSDCCHSRPLFDGTEDFAEFTMADGTPGCLHMDVSAAKDTIARMRTMEQDLGVHIALAHDISWILKGTNKTLLSLLDAELVRVAQEKCPVNTPL